MQIAVNRFVVEVEKVHGYAKPYDRVSVEGRQRMTLRLDGVSTVEPTSLTDRWSGTSPQALKVTLTSGEVLYLEMSINEWERVLEQHHQLIRA